MVKSHHVATPVERRVRGLILMQKPERFFGKVGADAGDTGSVGLTRDVEEPSCLVEVILRTELGPVVG